MARSTACLLETHLIVMGLREKATESYYQSIGNLREIAKKLLLCSKAEIEIFGKRPLSSHPIYTKKGYRYDENRN